VILDRHVPTFGVAGFIEAVAERSRPVRVGNGRRTVDERDHGHPRLLRPRRQRPRRRAAEQGDELAPPHHSITSSARASNVGGTSRLSALAVLRLMASSTFVTCCTGKSAGFSPPRTRPLAPGRFRLATNPNLTGSPPIRNTIGIDVVAALAANT